MSRRSWADVADSRTSRFRTSSAPMEWSELHDICLCREILVTDPFTAKRKTTQRAKLWEAVAEHLLGSENPRFKVTVRSVRDRYSRIAQKFKKRMRDEEKASGISPEVTELDVLLEEIIQKEEMSEEQRQNGEETKRKVEEDKTKAEDVRLKAMEKLSQTKKRKSEETSSGESTVKPRRTGSDTIAYLKEKNEQELEIRRQELELKNKQHEEERKRHDAASKRQEDMMQMMAQQNQMLMALMGKLVQK